MGAVEKRVVDTEVVSVVAMEVAPVVVQAVEADMAQEVNMVVDTVVGVVKVVGAVKVAEVVVMSLENNCMHAVMKRARKRKNVDTATRTRDYEIHNAEMEVPLINIVHGSRNTASRVDQGIPRAEESTFNVETTATSN
ncbi:hypothetical protein ACH5RR_039001 [Cinchona calisaya]|uniref:Uncharacterized protein n=1 Tax=Cinchona calisaya TaxID=153742 RepID=A0ABD2Y2J1_9GENT